MVFNTLAAMAWSFGLLFSPQNLILVGNITGSSGTGIIVLLIIERNAHMNTKILKSTLLAITWGVLILVFSSPTQAAKVPLMSKEELQQRLSDPQVIVLDVRTGQDWTSSEFKIKGAERVNPRKFKEWSDRYPKDQTLVLYCA